MPSVNGTYSLPLPSVVTGTTITSNWANTSLNDLAAALTQRMCRDGTSTALANFPMGGFKITGAGDASVAGDLLAYGQAPLNGFSSVASAATVDLGAVPNTYVELTGTTTISSFGTVAAGVWKYLRFAGILTLTRNAVSLEMPTQASITTAAGDTAIAMSDGSGNWRVLAYTRISGQGISGSVLFGDGTVGAPSITFASDTDLGFYRIGANNIGLSVGGTKRLDVSATSCQFTYGSTSSIGSAISLLSEAGSNVAVAGGASATAANAGNVTITGGSHTAGGSAGVRGDVTLTAGNQTFTSGTPGDRGGNVTLSGGAVSDPGASAVSGSVIMNIGAAGSAATPGYAVVQNSNGDPLFKVNANRSSVTVGGAAPTHSSGGGSGVAIAGKTNAFRITFGTGAGTTVVINLPTPTTGSGAFANAPVAAVNYESTSIAVAAAATTTQVTLTFGSAPGNGTICHVILLGYE